MICFHSHRSHIEVSSLISLTPRKTQKHNLPWKKSGLNFWNSKPSFICQVNSSCAVVCLVLTSSNGYNLLFTRLYWFAANASVKTSDGTSSAASAHFLLQFFFFFYLLSCADWETEGAHVIIGESQNARRSVVSEVHKHIVFWATAKSNTGMLERE